MLTPNPLRSKRYVRHCSSNLNTSRDFEFDRKNVPVGASSRVARPQRSLSKGVLEHAPKENFELGASDFYFYQSLKKFVKFLSKFIYLIFIESNPVSFLHKMYVC